MPDSSVLIETGVPAEYCTLSWSVFSAACTDGRVNICAVNDVRTQRAAAAVAVEADAVEAEAAAG